MNEKISKQALIGMTIVSKTITFFLGPSCAHMQIICVKNQMVIKNDAEQKLRN